MILAQDSVRMVLYLESLFLASLSGEGLKVKNNQLKIKDVLIMKTDYVLVVPNTEQMEYFITTFRV
jgi:hypothetical protein